MDGPGRSFALFLIKPALLGLICQPVNRLRDVWTQVVPVGLIQHKENESSTKINCFSQRVTNEFISFIYTASARPANKQQWQEKLRS